MVVEHRIAKVEKITAERDELFYKWSKTNGLTTREVATRCMEIVHEKATYDDQCDRTIEAIRKEYGLENK